MSKDPNSWIQASAETLAETLLSKNHDYAPEGEFSNFEKAAKIAGIGTMQAILSQAAIKMTRIESLAKVKDFNHESMKDSFLDLAGYAVIAHALLSAYEMPPGEVFPGYADIDPHWLVSDEDA